MPAQLIDGKEIAKQIRAELKSEVQALKEKNIYPGLAVVLVGNDPASETYVRLKVKACEKIGIYSEVIRMPETASEDQLLQTISILNERNDIHGILVQLPLPKQINPQKVIDQIRDEKDVDGFTPRNVGALVTKKEGFIPCTPLGILRLIKETGVSIEGKHAVVVGRSNIVGKPVATLLQHENATVTMCHSKTQNLEHFTKQADILVVAVGHPRLIKKEHVKPGAIVIDVGMNRLADGQLVGDVDFNGVVEIAGYITPVPGGVGPLTITMLLNNTIDAAKKFDQV